jgi:hypothetical protein
MLSHNVQNNCSDTTLQRPRHAQLHGRLEAARSDSGLISMSVDMARHRMYGADLQWRHVQHTLCSCSGVPGVGAARRALQSALQSAACLAVGDSCRRVGDTCSHGAADPAALMPLLLDPASVCRPQSNLVPVFVRVAADFLRAASAALVVAPLAASCVQGRHPTPVPPRRVPCLRLTRARVRIGGSLGTPDRNSRMSRASASSTSLLNATIHQTQRYVPCTPPHGTQDPLPCSPRRFVLAGAAAAAPKNFPLREESRTDPRRRRYAPART